LKIISRDAIDMPQVNRLLYPDGLQPLESNDEFYSRFCAWARSYGFADPEYLLPQIWVDNDIGPFLYERRFAASDRPPPTRPMIESYAPWYYYVEWKDVSSIRKEDSEIVLLFHRHRISMFRNLAADLFGDDRSALTLVDVACSSGVTALDFAEQGFKHVLGLELREESVRQANFLKRTFQVKDVEFKVEDARNVGNYSADVVFCGGLLYHVIFPVQLIESLFNAAGKMLILDSLCDNHPFSGFHVLGNRNVDSALEGDTAICFVPTYRGIIDLLRNAGFETIYEILGSSAPQVPLYSTRNVRSFLAVKPGIDLGIR
jgi:hypothetical protein